ncbi:MAG: aminotransferase class V-fold PLP-dependent enzyme [Actinomycetota bacterium]|jgi:cysteine desulfurase/selenocysteine lyase|nr:aminotransferase class V-fold PLP-dependent enzyme [Actinomycetota bacterium]
MKEEPPALAKGWAECKEEYLGDTGRTYLDTATKGMPPNESLTAMQDYYRALRRQDSRSATDQTISILEHLGEARRRAAALINASEEEIALVESTQQGIRVIAEALRLAPGSRVVTSDVEFLATVVPWRSLAGSAIRLEVVPGCAGAISLEALEASLTSETRVVCVSATQEVSGATLDLVELGRICRSHGVVSIVDATQYLGPRMLDVERTDLDCVVVGGSKWLCNPFGLGFLCVRAPLLEELRPYTYGYMALRLPPGGWSEFVANAAASTEVPAVFTSSASKFEGGGTGPYLSALTLAASLRGLEAVGPARIEARTYELTGALMDGLVDAGMKIVTPRQLPERAGIVTFTTGDEQRDLRLYDVLLDEEVMIAYRKSGSTAGIRVSPYFYNSRDDIERCLDVVKGFTC